MYLSNWELWCLGGAIVIGVIMFWSGYFCGRSDGKPRRDAKGRFIG